MIRVHATKASINGYKVRLLLSMLRKQYELVELDMYGGEHKREPYLTLNPFGQMPALTDGAFTIADSHACLVYLARKYDSTGNVAAGGRRGRGEGRGVAVEVRERSASGPVDETREDPPARRDQAIERRDRRALRSHFEAHGRRARETRLACSQQADDRRHLVLRARSRC